MAAIVTAAVVVPTPPRAPMTDSVRGLAAFAPVFAAIAPPVRSRSSRVRSTARPIAPSANGIDR